MSDFLIKKRFEEIDLNDHFFDSLKADYKEFEDWFLRKKDSEAYVFYENNKLEGFLYIKCESGDVTDVEPNIVCNEVLKIGTFKINPHGTRLGERFIKKALDYAIVNNVELCYVTIFDKTETESLIKLLKKYGFEKHGKKKTENGKEMVLVKHLTKITGDGLIDYPLIDLEERGKYLLAIYPEYHSVMFPDSILNNESVDILEDVAYTNSIHKIYVTTMPVNKTAKGDLIVMYRTKTEGKSAEYSSVATSICMVEEVRHQSEFKDFEEFYKYASKYSVFDRKDLNYWYNKGTCYTIKMTYNAALSKRLIRQKLADEVGLNRDHRWSFIRLTDEQFIKILKEGGVSESLIIN